MTPKELQRYNDRVAVGVLTVVVLSWIAICIAFALLGEGAGGTGEPIDSTHLLLF